VLDEEESFIDATFAMAKGGHRLDAALKECGFEPLIDRSEIYAFEDWWKRNGIPQPQRAVTINMVTQENVHNVPPRDSDFANRLAVSDPGHSIFTR
jgi:hypothetical protein